MRTLRFSSMALLGAAVAAAACGGDDTNPATAGSTSATSSSSGTGGGGGGTGGTGGGAPSPGPAFNPWCQGKDWSATKQPATLGKLYGKYIGVLNSPSVVAGVMEGQKFVPDHPFEVTKIRVAFAGEAGPARLRLVPTFGRTFPFPWPVTTDTSTDLMTPIDLEVDDPGSDKWIELDVPPGVFLLPTQHYNLVYEHIGPQPLLALEGVALDDPTRDPERDYSRAGIFLPKTKDGGGIGGLPDVPSVNYRVELVGNTFCQLADDARWFGEEPSAFNDEPSSYVTVADVDGNGHDDVIVYPPSGAVTYFGDGQGSFAKPAWDPFADAPAAFITVWGDVDNDGDEDAFAAPWVHVDEDADGYDVVTEHDCNNAPGVGKAIHPGAPEIMGNGIDDDCDGVADDGTDTSDADGDGFSIAAGDCDDTQPTIFPGNPELLDMLDNDCNGEVDETFVNKMLMNDGTGHFTAVPSSGVERIDPTTSGAFGDGNEDGALDLYWGNWLEVYPNDKAVQDVYVEGKGDGTFVDASAKDGLVLPKAYSAFGVLWNDWDGDGHQDILVDNYHLYPNQLWQNQGDGTFVDVGAKVGIAIDDIKGPQQAQYPGGHTFGSDFGDVDGDGDMDFYLCNLAHPRFAPWSDPSQFLLNQGGPSYVFSKNQLADAGFEYDEGDANVAFADLDNDGDLDVVISSLYEAHFTRIYRNDAGKFVDVTYDAGIHVRDAVSLSISDVDEDGDLDVLISDRGGAPYVHLFRNRVGQDAAWVEVELVGTWCARDGVGSRVALTAGGKTQLRDARLGGGHGGAQQTHWIHFGLGAADAVDTLTVRWVGGATETFTGVAPRGRYRLVEGNGAAMKL